MTNPSGRKGSAWESAIVAYLQIEGFPAERRARHGAKDRGDISGVAHTVIEAKACKVIDLPGFLREAEVERENDDAELGVVFIKRRNHAVEEGYAVVTIETFTRILKTLVKGEPW